MGNTIVKVINSQERSVIEHPTGLCLKMDRGVFPSDSKLTITDDTGSKLKYANRSFRVSSDEHSVKPMEISIRLTYKPDTQSTNRELIPFMEIKEEDVSYLLPGKIQEKIIRGKKQYHLTALWDVFKNDREIIIGDGTITAAANVKRVFHPVQHQFKIHQSLMEQDTNGNSRRRNENGEPCEEEPQNFYPACYPASWASLCNSYRMTPKSPRRVWETGTPTERNPPPNEFGDFFATWTMGTNPPGNRGNPPPATWVTDWRANPANSTPENVVMEAWIFPETTDAEELKDRAFLIKNVLLREVGGHSSKTFPHPVRMGHGGHGWVIVGVDEKGFWDHALAEDSWSFSSYCLWEKAPWLDKARAHGISFPVRSWVLKPEERRLGCINLEGSSDRNKMKRVRFWDVHTGLDMNTINWTPHTETDPGYLWIRGKEPLTCHGFPERDDPTFDPNLGHTIPQPLNDFGNCPNCNSIKEGCRFCRLRLLLPFWVHNTTLDENVTYKVDLYFWSKYQRWLSLKAKSLPETSSSQDDELYCGFDIKIRDGIKKGRWIDYNLPGPLPGEYFSIQALVDTKQGLERPEPWNSQGFAWYVDLHKNQLNHGSIHGIRLVLTCGQRSSKPICLVQDVKQIWFRVGHIAPY